MAQRRMFSMKIIDTDLFLDMPDSSQLLYFHLCMRADDDGFVSSPRKIMKFLGASEDDMKLLIGKNFLIPFESGVCVIRDWRVHNYIQNDRYTPTQYTEEKAQLISQKGKPYELVGVCDYSVDTKCIQDVSEVLPQVRLGKVRLGKDREEAEEDNTSSYSSFFHDPNLAEVLKTYEANIMPVSPIIGERAEDWLSDTCLDAVLYAIQQAALANAKSANFVNAIVISMKEFGVKDKNTLELYKADRETRKNKGGQSVSVNKPPEGIYNPGGF